MLDPKCIYLKSIRPKVYLSKEYFCEMYPTCVSSKLCEFILSEPIPYQLVLSWYIHQKESHQLSFNSLCQRDSDP